MSVLEAKNLIKRFGKRTVVKGVDFIVKSGEVVGLLGPNGAGKTTSFYMVIGLTKSDEGIVSLDGVDIANYPMYKRARCGISYLPQEPSVFRKLNVEENLLIVLENLDLNRSQQQDRCNELLQRFGIKHLRSAKAYTLSGGERRRVEIARSLALDPKFILLDEPFSGIDPLAVIDIQNIIKELKNMNIGILITDHNVRETLGICDRGYILNDGLIQFSGTPREIVNDETARRVYLGEDFTL